MIRSRGAAAFAALVLAGCRHLIEPIRPQAVPLDELQAVSLPEGAAVRLENDRPVPAILHLRTEGFHRLDIDLSDWSARLVSELAFEMKRRGIAVFVPAWAFAGTAVEPERRYSSPRSAPPREVPLADPLSLPALRVRVSSVRAADPETGEAFLVAAELASEPAGFRAAYASGEGARGFADALYDLKKKILDDAAFQAWLRSAAVPSGVGEAGSAR